MQQQESPTDRIIVAVTIFGKEYGFACAPEEKNQLEKAAALLNEKMQEVRNIGRIVGQERTTLMAGIMLAKELIQTRSATQKIWNEAQNDTTRLITHVDINANLSETDNF